MSNDQSMLLESCCQLISKLIAKIDNEDNLLKICKGELFKSVQKILRMPSSDIFVYDEYTKMIFEITKHCFSYDIIQ